MDVRRGHVEVDNKGDKSRVLLAVGQSAVVDKAKSGGATKVSGDGKLPSVVDSKGQPLTTSVTFPIPTPSAPAADTTPPAIDSATVGAVRSGHDAAEPA